MAALAVFGFAQQEEDRADEEGRKGESKRRAMRSVTHGLDFALLLIAAAVRLQRTSIAGFKIF